MGSNPKSTLVSPVNSVSMNDNLTGVPIEIESGLDSSTPINWPEIIGPSSSSMTEKQYGFFIE